MDGILSSIRKRRDYFFIYLATLFLSFHYYLTVYINSSFLELHFPAQTVSVLYAAAALITIVVFLLSPRILRVVGNTAYLLYLTLIEIFVLYGLGHEHAAPVILFLFLLHQAIPPLILFSLDIFLEQNPHTEGHTGNLRGLMLTVANIALVASPLTVSAIVIGTNFLPVYRLAALALIPVLLIGFFPFREFKNPKYPSAILKTIHSFLKNSRIRKVFVADLLLQIFYAWMAIYTPVYLHQYLNFSWSEIGLLFTIMLVPFLLFELPVGMLADKYFGEKEFMTSGLLIIALSTAALSFVSSVFAFIAIILFISRIGASFLEASSETYFFKQVGGHDANLISVFRMTRPLSFLITPLLGTIIISITSLRQSFFWFSIIIACGIFVTLRLKDTK